MKESEFQRLASVYNNSLKMARLDLCIDPLLKMAGYLHLEKKYKDELKFRMLAFYIGLSGCAGEPFIDHWEMGLARDAYIASGMEHYEMMQLYLDIIDSRRTPKHIMGVHDSLFLFDLCMEGRIDDAEHIIIRFTENRAV